ncbi:MAG: hypothetical protein QXY18_04175 [Nitrososphaerota archaeon]
MAIPTLVMLAIIIFTIIHAIKRRVGYISFIVMMVLILIYEAIVDGFYLPTVFMIIMVMSIASVFFILGDILG